MRTKRGRSVALLSQEEHIGMEDVKTPSGFAARAFPAAILFEVRMSTETGSNGMVIGKTLDFWRRQSCVICNHLIGAHAQSKIMNCMARPSAAITAVLFWMKSAFGL